jgi:hypothetical protein
VPTLRCHRAVADHTGHDGNNVRSILIDGARLAGRLCLGFVRNAGRVLVTCASGHRDYVRHGPIEDACACALIWCVRVCSHIVRSHGLVCMLPIVVVYHRRGLKFCDLGPCLSFAIYLAEIMIYKLALSIHENTPR